MSNKISNCSKHLWTWLCCRAISNLVATHQGRRLKYTNAFCSCPRCRLLDVCHSRDDDRYHFTVTIKVNMFYICTCGRVMVQSATTSDHQQLMNQLPMLAFSSRSSHHESTAMTGKSTLWVSTKCSTLNQRRLTTNTEEIAVTML